MVIIGDVSTLSLSLANLISTEEPEATTRITTPLAFYKDEIEQVNNTSATFSINSCCFPGIAISYLDIIFIE